MKIKNHKLNKIIDNYLLSNPELINEQQGNNPTIYHTLASSGENCKINISPDLQLLGMNKKAADIIAKGISFAVGAFGLNLNQCNIINAALGFDVITNIKDKNKEKFSGKIFSTHLGKANKDDFIKSVFADTDGSRLPHDPSDSLDTVIARWKKVHKSNKESPKSYMDDFQKDVIKRGAMTSVPDQLSSSSLKVIKGNIDRYASENNTVAAYEQLILELKDIMMSEPAVGAINSKIDGYEISEWKKAVKENII